ncbi:MAG: pilin [Sweet potato little leaf phytoplasma]|nr:pilin [Sweet potato little leaf phytoplasma]
MAAIALPAYQDYTARAKVSEVVLAASACRTTITEVVQSSSALPDADAWGCESASSTSNYVRSIATDGEGVVTVTAQNINGAIDGQTLTLIPSSSADDITAPEAGGTIARWICGGEGTTIPAKFLPGSCRG